MNNTKISILLPSRGRTDILERSIMSLINTADDIKSVEFLLAFDKDDPESSKHFVENIAPKISEVGSKFFAFEFDPMGYGNLHKYLNKLGKFAKAPWWVFWNDDAVMKDHSWDTVISSQSDKFCIQAFDTHNLHPYSIFPIVPRAWFDLLGHLSQHPLNDAYISQIAWMLDIMVRIPIKVDHERYDLTGKNKDSTFENRVIYEGNIHHPLDFNHVSNRKLRLDDAGKVATYLESKGYDMSNWIDIIKNNGDPWKKMLDSDVNNQVKRVERT